MEESKLILLPEGYQLQSFLRIASISVALYDYLETFPTAWKIYRAQWRSRRLTTRFLFFVLIRLSSVVVLTLSSIGHFYDGFDDSLCKGFSLLPPIFKVFQVMVSQAILGFRVYNLAQRSNKVLYAGLFIYVATCSLEWVSTLLLRKAQVGQEVHNCRAFNTEQGNFGAWAFYAIAIAYDVLMISASVFLLLKQKLTSSSGSIMRKLANMMLYDGLGYLISLTAINILNLILYRTSEDIQSAAASLGYCLTWIMSQRLLIHIQDASRERRMENEDAVLTITTDGLSPREVREVVRTQLGHKHSASYSFSSRQQQRHSDLEQIFNPNNPEEFDVRVRIERTVKVERLPRTMQMEDYTRRSRGRNTPIRH